jgi:hypothetical protein
MLARHQDERRDGAPRCWPISSNTSILSRCVPSTSSSTETLTGLYVGYVPGWPGAHSQGATFDELQGNLKEVVAMLLEDGEPPWSPCSWGFEPSRLPSGQAAHAEAPGGSVTPGEQRFCRGPAAWVPQTYRHADGRGTTVPFHAGRDISPTLLRKIAKDIGLTVEQLLGRGEGGADQQ